MLSNTGTDDQAAREPAEGETEAARKPSWPLALASVGVCLGTAAAITLIATLA